LLSFRTVNLWQESLPTVVGKMEMAAIVVACFIDGDAAGCSITRLNERGFT
jgi:hypothetical protein